MNNRLIFCLFLGVWGKLYPKEKRDEICSDYGYTLVEAKFGKEAHLLCLKMRTIDSSLLTADGPALLLDPEPDEDELQASSLPLDDVTMAYGFPVDAPDSGTAEGYIGDDNQFYGVLHLGNRTLHADPYGTDDPAKQFGDFDLENMLAPVRPRRNHAQFPGAFSDQIYFPFNIEENSQKPGVARARICDLLLLADQEFFIRDANSSLTHVVRRMIHAVAQADIIFRNADFNEDGVPDNIGFSIKYILVLTSNETNGRVFGDITKSHIIDGRSYLMRFARLRRLSEVCLGIAFSGHAFHNRTLGLSFTSLGGGLGGAAGGLCDRRAYGRSFNTLALAHATAEDKERVPERIAALTLAHEMGHSFGAHHDDNFPNPECRGYLMGSQSSSTENAMHFEFSLCSKRLIAATLSSMSYCLSMENKPFCGNGIVEDGEACDCGLPSRCIHGDPCCTPRAGGALVFAEGALHKEGCSVAPSAVCHPSQGPCCSHDCQYADLSRSGINCKNLDLTCACNSSKCICGLGGRCSGDGTCHAAECIAIGLRECQCTHKKLVGTLSEARLCSICCELPAHEQAPPRCVSALTAARELMRSKELPIKWLDDEYRGPNISSRLCGNERCNATMVRAWRAGEACVTRNAVGVCSLRGVCKIAYVPRSNVYPDAMHIKLVNVKSSSEIIEMCVRLYLLMIVLF